MNTEVFTPDEIRMLKALASSLLNAMGRGATAAAPAKAPTGKVATTDELSDRFGDPKVRKDPKRWAGESYVGATYSRCPSEYLVELAGYMEWIADKEAQKPEPKRHRNGTPFYEYDLKNAALARGWALRNEGKAFSPPVQETAMDAPFGSDDQAPVNYDQTPADEWVP
jgi:hypothetical protein